jgi:hypothetical protein
VVSNVDFQKKNNKKASGKETIISFSSRQSHDGIQGPLRNSHSSVNHFVTAPYAVHSIALLQLSFTTAQVCECRAA